MRFCINTSQLYRDISQDRHDDRNYNYNSRPESPYNTNVNALDDERGEGPEEDDEDDDSEESDSDEEEQRPGEDRALLADQPYDLSPPYPPRTTPPPLATPTSAPRDAVKRRLSTDELTKLLNEPDPDFDAYSEDDDDSLSFNRSLDLVTKSPLLPVHQSSLLGSPSRKRSLPTSPAARSPSTKNSFQRS